MKQEEYWKILDKTNDWIKFSDTKAVVILTFYGIIITAIYSNSNEVYAFLSGSIFSISIAIIAVLLSITSVLFSFLSINPRLRNLNPHSILYFGHIQENYSNYTDYFEHSRDVISNDTEYEKQIAEQIYVNSKIAWKKFKNITYSLRCFFLSILSIFLLMIHYFINQ